MDFTITSSESSNSAKGNGIYSKVKKKMEERICAYKGYPSIPFLGCIFPGLQEKLQSALCQMVIK
jgi:hypothetical protein